MSGVESSFAIVAEPNRRAILSLLLSSERSVGEIERKLRLSQPSVSKHLRVLREAGNHQNQQGPLVFLVRHENEEKRQNAKPEKGDLIGYSPDAALHGAYK